MQKSKPWENRLLLLKRLILFLWNFFSLLVWIYILRNWLCGDSINYDSIRFTSWIALYFSHYILRSKVDFLWIFFFLFKAAKTEIEMRKFWGLQLLHKESTFGALIPSSHTISCNVEHTILVQTFIAKMHLLVPDSLWHRYMWHKSYISCLLHLQKFGLKSHNSPWSKIYWWRIIWYTTLLYSGVRNYWLWNSHEQMCFH